MSAEALWQPEVRSIRAELAEVKKCLDDHDIDLYRGKSLNDPPVTRRLADAEGRLDRIEKSLAADLLAREKSSTEAKDRQKETRSYLVAILTAVLGLLTKDHLLIPAIHAIFH